MDPEQEQAYVRKLDLIAEEYHNAEIPDKFIEGICQEYTLGWLFDQLGDKQQILELGYGDGIISHALANKGLPFEIIEGSQKVIASATQSLPGISITKTLFESFAPDKRYDSILALHVLEHVDAPVELLKRMHSWLDGPGTIIIIVPNKNSLHRQLAVTMGLQDALDDLSPRDHAVGHQRVYSLQTFEGGCGSSRPDCRGGDGIFP